MSEEEVAFLENLLRMFPGKVFYFSSYDGQYLPIARVAHNHRDTNDPAEPPESVAWIGGYAKPDKIVHAGKCVGLLGADPADFKVFQEVPVVWPS